MSIWLMVAMWCIIQPVPFCMRMEMPDLTKAQCEAMKPVALNMAQNMRMVKFDAYCVVGTKFPT